MPLKGSTTHAEFICPVCHQPFTVLLSVLKYRTPTTCSMKCKRARWGTPDWNEQRFWERVDTTGDCWLWTGGTIRAGYGIIAVAPGVHPKLKYAHRLSWEIHNGPIPDGMVICHRCDNPRCVNPAHLFVGTQRDNIRDMDAKGRCKRANQPKGERHSQAKLTTGDVRAIRAEAERGVPTRELATQFNVSVDTIRLIVRRKAWKHV